MARPQREVPWLDIRGDTYYVNWYDPNTGRTGRQSLKTRDPAVAQSRYIAFLTGTRPTDLTVADILDSYLSEHVDLSDPGRQKIAAAHLKAFFGTLAVSRIGIPETRTYALARPVSSSTVRRELVVLGAAIRHAVRWKRLPPGEASSLELPPGAPVQAAKFLSRDELKRILTIAGQDPDPRLHAFIVLAYGSGARRSRIENLTKAQVDLDAMRLRLKPEGERVTRKRAPVVPITPQMAVEIRKLLLRSGASDYLFGSASFDAYRGFSALMRRIGVLDRSGPHILRHSRATHMLQDGGKIWDVASLLGDTPETIRRVYGHHCPDYLGGQDAIRDMGGVI